MIRLTWVQPEDLVGHELRQAAEDGRDVREIAARWRAAGGHDAPPRAGASEPGALRLRPLAERLLDELAAIPSPLGEPTDLDAIIAATPAWPAHRPGTRTETQPGTRTGASPAPSAPSSPSGAVPAVDPARLLGAWEGRAAGCVLGKPVEKIPREGVREIAQATGNWPIRGWFTARGLPADVAARWPWNRRSAVNSLAENIDGVPEDDDLNYPLLALTVLERHGRGFTTDDVAKLWLDELPAGRTFTAERVAYRNLLSGVEPPATATHRNPFREWIGALIRTDVYGWVNPGDPATAAEYAWRDARLTHTANGVYGAMFAAALCAQSLVATSVEEVLAAGLSVVPPASRLHDAVRRAAEDAASEPDFERVLDRLHERHAGLHWVHTINNAALIAAALVHGRGDFTASIAGAVAGGWDTDSAGATVGSVAGALNGGVPARWKMRNSLASSLTGFDGIGLDELARRTRELMRA
ncbi:ADP-ribosylglycohydrolase family protein [Nonomuraea rhodomycinica]|uniref:ADP-ribosylglycohydrolase family protein n=1 Tax=Nonomuraea rhodomycinica TaxID=1712872 RepID=A0A7Y6MEY7_9ACTN|nr:ADP-ribosylglycohydrolase family protein [Nonomuraea rhodomycinica]NUW45437.1 ADP-ribosylglycohydrolase family protein [Nonomuraea rhodomycinica]